MDKTKTRIDRIKAFFYVLFHQVGVKTVRCDKCNAPVLRSDLCQYRYQCLSCDEDLFGIETHKGHRCTKDEARQLRDWTIAEIIDR